MDTDQWHERIDWGNYLEESGVIRSMDDAELQAEHTSDDDRRIFRLADFFVFEKSTMKLIPLPLENLDNITIAGRAIPIFPDDDLDGYSEDEQEMYQVDIRLSAISKVEYTYLDVSAAGQDGIYILTCFAWYLLECPAGFYRTPYQEPFRQFRLTLTILRRAYEHPEERLSEFVTKFRRLAERADKRYTNALRWGYPALHPADLQESSAAISRNIMFYIEYLGEELDGETDGIRRANLNEVRDRLNQSPIVSNSLKGHLATIRRRHEDSPAPLGNNLTESPAFQIERNGGNPYEIMAEIYDSDEDMLDEDAPIRRSVPARRTCVSPIVERIARKTFSAPLNLVGQPLPDVTWRESRSGGTPVAPETRLKRGQCILMPAGIDEGDPQQDWAFNNEKTSSANQIANDYWFAQIISNSPDAKQIHVRWFDHSAKSDLLKEFERPMELFLTNRCVWLSRHHVERLVDIKFLGPDEEPPNTERHYYVRFIREHLNGAFVRLRPSDYTLPPSPSTACPVCDAMELQEIHFENKTMRIAGVEMHKGEFIVINPPARAPWFRSNKDQAEPGFVVQVLSVHMANKNGRRELQSLSLRGLERAEALRKRGLIDEVNSTCEGRPVRDERRMCLMDKWELSIDIKLAKRSPIRKCFVRHPDDFHSVEAMNEWLDRSALHFIVDLQGHHNEIPAGMEYSHPRVVFSSVPGCAQCGDDSSRFRVTKMRMLDMFSGAGGLSKGLVESGICEARYAIDHDSAALDTYKANFPGVIPIHRDVNVSLSKTLVAALDQEHVRSAPDDPDDPPPLPEQHEIDFICGGPPCQSFSGANRFKKEDDPRTTMVAAVLSAVEHYRPKYFVIENVPDALTYKIAGPVPRASSADSNESVELPKNYIEQGILRFLMRTTLDLGYSFRVGVLQAGQYGAPQHRRRAYILGARPDLFLPEFPLATHRVSVPETGMKLPTGGYLDVLDVRSGFALHPPTTVWDAIGDLSPFDWINPHERMPQTQSLRNEAHSRRVTMGIPAYNAVHADRCEVGLGEGGAAAGYRAESPFTSYQMKARGDLEEVTGHYTSSFKSGVFVERVVTVPVSAKADHRALPEALRRGDFLSDIFGSGGASGYYRGAFGRYDKSDQFATILTSLRPAKKNGYCIHPEQKRMLTMRELARAQGFPDDFVFHGSVDEVNRQIGNAVVIQVAQAIGKEIKKSLMKAEVI